MKRLLTLVGPATIGCTAPKRHLTLGLPRTEVAEVRGLDESSGSFGLPPPERHIHFQAIDGLSLEKQFEDGLPRIIDLRPGEHTLRCWCKVNPVGAPPRMGTCDVLIPAEAGHVYQMKMDWGPNSVVTGHTFTVLFRDITKELEDLEQRRVEVKDAEIARRKDARSKFDPY